jgi:hypothetical protein
MNSQLKDRIFKIPDNIFDYIHKVFTSLEDKKVDGTQRAKNLLRTKNVTYAQIKRIIHDLENGDPNSTQYKLAGGELMLTWGKTHLNGERDLIKNNKKSKQRADNIGQINDIRKNSFLKTHTKKSKDYKVPTNMLKSNSDKTSISPISSLGIFEEIQRIKDLL